MKKISLALIMVILITLTACKPNVDINVEHVFESDLDLHEIEVTIINSNEYNIKGSLQYTSENDLDNLVLMMYPNTTNNDTHKVTINTLMIDGSDVSYTITGTDKSAIDITLNDSISINDDIYIEYDMDVEYGEAFRLQHYGDVIYQMYFYPYVAMYKDGFEIEPYTFRGETYYNILMNYDVTIILDKDFTVAAPGLHIGSERDGDMTKHRYVLEKARDFSFSASTHYSVYEFETEGRSYEIYSVRELTSVEEANTEQYLKQSFDIYEMGLGAYDYDRFILELGHIYGMESSGIIYCSEDISETTIVHEVIHQWFFFMVGNDSYDDSFIDESLTTYITAYYYYKLYGMQGYNNYLNYRTSDQERFAEYWNTYGNISLLSDVEEFGDGFGFVIYYHGPSIYREYVKSFLDEDVERFVDIIQAYFEEYKYEIVDIDELLDFLEEESGVEGTKEWFLFHINNLQDVTNLPNN